MSQISYTDINVHLPVMEGLMETLHRTIGTARSVKISEEMGRIEAIGRRFLPPGEEEEVFDDASLPLIETDATEPLSDIESYLKRMVTSWQRLSGVASDPCAVYEVKKIIAIAKLYSQRGMAGAVQEGAANRTPFITVQHFPPRKRLLTGPFLPKEEGALWHFGTDFAGQAREKFNGLEKAEQSLVMLKDVYKCQRKAERVLEACYLLRGTKPDDYPVGQFNTEGASLSVELAEKASNEAKSLLSPLIKKKKMCAVSLQRIQIQKLREIVLIAGRILQSAEARQILRCAQLKRVVLEELQQVRLDFVESSGLGSGPGNSVEIEGGERLGSEDFAQIALEPISLGRSAVASGSADSETGPW